MRPSAISIVVVLVGLACAATIYGAGMDYPTRAAVYPDPEWPQGLADLVNSEGWVHGFLINANDYFFFTGDTNAFNRFVERYGKLKETPLRLVLHPGRTAAQSPWSRGNSVPCEWRLSVLRRGWDSRAPEQPGPEGGRYVVLLDLWLGGQVELDRLEVPLTIEVTSGGEIEGFVAAHEKDRKGQNLAQ